MKVVFLEDDRIEQVSDGYARNYLFPKKLAVAATEKMLAVVEARKEKKQAELVKVKEEMQALGEKLSALEVSIPVDAGEGGKLFGSVTSADIGSALKSAAGVEIDKRKIILSEPIKVVGEHRVLLKLSRDVSAPLKVIVTAR